MAKSTRTPRRRTRYRLVERLFGRNFEATEVDTGIWMIGGTKALLVPVSFELPVLQGTAEEDHRKDKDGSHQDKEAH